MESQKSNSTGFYAISFEKKCKKYIYINYSHFLKLTSSTLIINFSSRNKLISMDFFFNGESKRLSRSGKDEGRKKWRGARVVTQDFHFPWKLLKKKTWPVSVLSFDRQRDLERLRTFPTFFAAAHYRIGRQREQKRSNFEKLETDGGETILLRGYRREITSSRMFIESSRRGFK